MDFLMPLRRPLNDLERLGVHGADSFLERTSTGVLEAALAELLALLES